MWSIFPCRLHFIAKVYVQALFSSQLLTLNSRTPSLWKGIVETGHDSGALSCYTGFPWQPCCNKELGPQEDAQQIKIPSLKFEWEIQLSSLIFIWHVAQLHLNVFYYCKKKRVSESFKKRVGQDRLIFFLISFFHSFLFQNPAQLMRIE